MSRHHEYHPVQIGEILLLRRQRDYPSSVGVMSKFSCSGFVSCGSGLIGSDPHTIYKDYSTCEISECSKGTANTFKI